MDIATSNKRLAGSLRIEKAGTRELKMPLLFLMRLALVDLPLKVFRPEEIMHVSVLKATGLIEAEFTPPLRSNGKYVPTQTAIVICITDEGMAELERMRDVRRQRKA